MGTLLLSPQRDNPHRTLRIKELVIVDVPAHDKEQAYLADFHKTLMWLCCLLEVVKGIYYSGIKLNPHTCQQVFNQNTGTKDKIDVEDSEKEDETDQDCFELPIWHSYSSTNSSSSKSNNKKRGLREEEQVFLDDLARLQRQEKEANKEAEALRKDLEQE
ncbi:hypothetical protein Tco_0573282 [Tanacetum coccineum]